MRILFLGLGEPIPTFVQRRLNQLSAAGVECICAIRSGQEGVLKLPSGRTVVMPRLGVKDAAASLKIALSLLLRPLAAYRLWKTRPQLSWRQKIGWLIAHYPISRLRGIDIIHLQWIGMADDYRWLRGYFQCPVIGSARGSQVTVYPHTSPAYLEKLQRCFEAVDYVHCVSEDIRRHCINWGVSPGKLFVNYNGIDLQFFSPPSQPLSRSGEIQLISVGALIWRKGYIFQLQVLQQLRKRGLSCRLHIIGSGADLQGLQYTAHALGISEWVEFHGALPPEQVRDLLRQSHIYLSTSAAEGLANSVLEAAACGLPVVAFACEGMEEVIKTGDSGFIVPYGDTAQLTDCIYRLAIDKEALLSMGKAARQHSIEKFDRDIHLAGMLNFYHTISAA